MINRISTDALTALIAIGGGKVQRFAKPLITYLWLGKHIRKYLCETFALLVSLRLKGTGNKKANLRLLIAAALIHTVLHQKCAVYNPKHFLPFQL
jgi:hypothetical protein